MGNREKEKRKRFLRVIKQMENEKDNAILDKSFYHLDLFLKIKGWKKAHIYRLFKDELEELKITTNASDFGLLLQNDKTRSFNRRWKLKKFLQMKLDYENVLVEIQKQEKSYDGIIRDFVTKINLVKKNL